MPTPISITSGITADMEFQAARPMKLFARQYQAGEPIPNEVMDRVSIRLKRQLSERRWICPVGAKFVTGGIRREHQVVFPKREADAELRKAELAAEEAEIRRKAGHEGSEGAEGALSEAVTGESGGPGGADPGEGDAPDGAFERPYAAISKGGGWFKVVDANGAVVQESIRKDDADRLLEGNEEV